MRRQQLAQRLAVGLSRGRWSVQVLTAELERRLPQKVRALAHPLAVELVLRHPKPCAPTVRQVQQMLLQDASFDRVFQYCQKYGVWPDVGLSSPGMAPADPFASLDLPVLSTPGALADWLFLPMERLDYLADPNDRHEDHGETCVNHYHYVMRAKKSGGHRVIEAPKGQLKSVQRAILGGILDKVPVHGNAFGFTRGRDCLGGADRHVGEEVVVCFDLQDYFTSIRRPRVFGLFRYLGYPEAVARYLACLCTTVTPTRIRGRLPFEQSRQLRSPHLPQGAPTSPALANLVSYGLDRRLSGLAAALDAGYSRYADDLAFSGDHGIVASLLRTVPEIVREEGFVLNAKKTRAQPQSARQVVTGVVVNAHLNVSRKEFDRLKAIIHACARSEDTRLEDVHFQRHLIGRLDWVTRVNPPRGVKLKRLLQEALLIRESRKAR